jgi:hypothetical protein
LFIAFIQQKFMGMNDVNPGRIGKTLLSQMAVTGRTFADAFGTMDDDRSVFEVTDGDIVPAFAAVQGVLPGEDETFYVV